MQFEVWVLKIVVRIENIVIGLAKKNEYICRGFLFNNILIVKKRTKLAGDRR
ncbi:hypothetical protein HMPREF3033_01351 [Veillonellaceae bacterium DNF00751]|nr:hypothetical protein HMPREF3033_01351 [Veillonellaceae bacterium DNF00751]